jgi:hypothetical protein
LATSGDEVGQALTGQGFAASGSGEPVNRPQRPPELTVPEYWFNWGFAVVLVVVFVVAGIILWQFVDNDGIDEARWHRYVYVFSAYHALVFTAVGWIFGREVHRSTAERAITDAKEGRQEATAAKHEANQEALNGRALAEAVKASVHALGGVQGFVDASSTDAKAAASQLNRLKRIADQCYP